jgi:hypothetical protein
VPAEPTLIRDLLAHHFGDDRPEHAVRRRGYPLHSRADLQQALDELLPAGDAFTGIYARYDEMNFARLISPDEDYPCVAAAPEREEVDTGEAEPATCLALGLWFCDDDHGKYAVLLSPRKHYSESNGQHLDVAALPDSGAATTLFARIEQAIRDAKCYRGKILSFEKSDGYSGRTGSLKVHRLDAVAEDQLILPAATAEALRSNVFDFIRQRPRLAELGLSTRKGLLFHGPPGTGKTHTIRHLATRLPDHTVLLVTAEQIGLLSEYAALARLLQPALVVVEDVDLVARDRTQMRDGCDEVMLNKLLNEMDGLRESADVIFVLTTNRLSALEPALAQRPGRVDQAIEFPLPDADARRRLIALHAGRAPITNDALDDALRRTDGRSPAFIKELLRRAAGLMLDRAGESITQDDIRQAVAGLILPGDTAPT